MAKKKFEHVIRVGWGDCDPAKIVYTGRLPWFACEAIDAFWEHVTGGDGWFQLELDRGIGTPFVHLSMNFKKPVTPRHRLVCKVWPTRLGKTSITFRVEAFQNKELCFDAMLVAVFVRRKTFKKTAPPKTLADRLGPYLRPEKPVHEVINQKKAIAV